MRYLSVCSGIEAASVAWEPMGWTPVGFSEIEPFPCSVLKQRYPNVPNFGDMTKHESWEIRSGSIDVLVGGTPCQSFSVAGRRGGLEDARGKLMLAFLGIAERLRPRFIVWENVPGVLSSNDGKDFGTFLGALGNLGYGWAYRILDAQWCRVDGFPKAVPQRRRRIFLVGCFGDGERAAKILFERESVQRDPAPRRKAGQGTPSVSQAGVGAGVSATVTPKWEGLGGPSGTLCGSGAGCDRAAGQGSELDFLVWPAQVAASLGLNGKATFGCSNQEIFSQNASGLVPYDLFQITAPVNRQNRKPGDPCHTLARDNAAHAAIAFSSNMSDQELFAQNVSCLIPYDLAQIVAPENSQNRKFGDPCHTLIGHNARRAAIAFSSNMNAPDATFEISPPVKVGTSSQSGQPPAVASMSVSNKMFVRRLTPRECERLQGFPDDWTLVTHKNKLASDGPRYKAIGNSIAVNVMRWLGGRIENAKG